MVVSQQRVSERGAAADRGPLEPRGAACAPHHIVDLFRQRLGLKHNREATKDRSGTEGRNQLRRPQWPAVLGDLSSTLTPASHFRRIYRLRASR